jgi:putative SOS response-associated peptidase YedK
MCGRYGVDISRLPARWGEVHETLSYQSWNVAPGQVVPILLPAEHGSGLALRTARWGLIPGWWKDATPPRSSFNARAETVSSKPMFRDAFRRRRCIVPAQFFYEWTPGLNGGRQPYLFQRRDGETLAFAGLWDSWRTPEGREVDSCCILTCAANALLGQLHDRMPVVIEADAIRTWLAGSPALAASLAVPAAPAVLKAHPVDRRVGNVRNNEPSLIEPVEAPALRNTDSA